jgi:hypothetical protein
MNLELFLVFSVMSLIFICFAYFVRSEFNLMSLALIGFITLFLLGGLLSFGAITQKTGQTIVSSGSGYDVTYNYSVVNDSTSVWIGRWVAIVCAVGFAVTLANNNSKTKGDDDE